MMIYPKQEFQVNDLNLISYCYFAILDAVRYSKIIIPIVRKKLNRNPSKKIVPNKLNSTNTIPNVFRNGKKGIL